MEDMDKIIKKLILVVLSASFTNLDISAIHLSLSYTATLLNCRELMVPGLGEWGRVRGEECVGTQPVEPLPLATASHMITVSSPDSTSALAACQCAWESL